MKFGLLQLVCSVLPYICGGRIPGLCDCKY